MSYQFTEEKKRPPPITLPLPPPPRPLPATSQQWQQGQRSTDNTPLTSPIESQTPASGSGRSRTAMTTFVNLIDRARSPRKSDHGSWISSNVGSTARSRQSGRSQHEAVAAQAQIEALDEETARGKVESRAEKNLFKMTSQVPPTPIIDSTNENEIYIRREDLRRQCRIASEEQQPEREDPSKSPKKKLFQNLRNTFSKSSSTAVPPAMPNKAAQILGTASRQARIIPVRPIKPARPVESTPTRTSRSDTVKSLPAKIVDPDNHAHRHRRGSSRRNRTSGRGSPGRGSLKKQSYDIENISPVPDVNESSDSVIPPSPPAKDTPPQDERQPSPLRRAAPTRGDLRNSYSDFNDNISRIRFPKFELSPVRSSGTLPGHGGSSPTKSRPYTAEDYTKLIEDRSMQWPYPTWKESPSKAEGKHPVPLAGVGLSSLQLPRPDRMREERPNTMRETSADKGPHLLPHFYSPSRIIPFPFAEGETPSKNSDEKRLLYSHPAGSRSLLHPREESAHGSIKMIFQGDRQDIEPNSPTARELDENEQLTHESDRRSDVGITTRGMQELRIGEQSENSRQRNGNLGDQSSSRLTDMLNAASPGRSESQGDFQLYCPSAIPSPLHKISGPPFSARASVPSGSYSAIPQPLPPKSIKDHFFMTNEHLDVVGKTTWDALETFGKEQENISQARHDDTLALINRRFKQLSSHLDAIKETANRVETSIDRVREVADSQHNIYATVNTIKDSIKETIPDAFKEQDKKMTCIEAEMKEMKQIIQALQKSMDQKAAETSNTPQPPFPSHNQRSPHSLHGHCGNIPEVVRDLQPVMQHGMSSPQDGHSDARLGYQNGNHNGNQWAARTAYAGRNGKEERPSYAANPYLYNNGGQYSSGYSGGGYPPFG
ncbi:hypothetical protein J4E91_000445 [Alternaria rosae]|nr:hypothetical protein J4E91_000445 [Alternaria rosae]